MTAQASPLEESPDVMSAFVDATAEVLAVGFGLELPVDRVANASQHATANDLIAAIPLASDTTAGLLLVSAPRSMAEILVSQVLGEEVSAESDLLDGMCEVVNMIAGRSRAILASTVGTFELMLPFGFVGGLSGLRYSPGATHQDALATLSEEQSLILRVWLPGLS